MSAVGRPRKLEFSRSVTIYVEIQDYQKIMEMAADFDVTTSELYRIMWRNFSKNGRRQIKEIIDDNRDNK